MNQLDIFKMLISTLWEDNQSHCSFYREAEVSDFIGVETRLADFGGVTAGAISEFAS